MGKFGDAIKQGLDAQERLKQAQSDLREVLREVAVDLSADLGREFQVTISLRNELVEGLQTKMNEMLGILPTKSKRQFWAIQISVPGKGSVSLAEVTFAEVGYPISVRWPDNFAHASDKDSFAAAMVELLSSRHAGEQIGVLLAL